MIIIVVVVIIIIISRVRVYKLGWSRGMLASLFRNLRLEMHYKFANAMFCRVVPALKRTR